MAVYESFAAVYDRFMDTVPYDQWSDRIRDLLLEAGIRDGLVVDLGCGTGQMTRRMRERGYDMIGIDLSEDMLQVAMEEEARGHSGADSAGRGQKDILYLCQDMRSFELYGTVRAIYSACDCMNYLQSEEDLRQVFRLAENYLDPYGLLVFDMNTDHYYREELGQNTFADIREDCSFIWENDYDPESRENLYDLTIFTRQPGGLYRKSQETHVERAFSYDRVRALAEQAGLIFRGAYDGYSAQPLREGSDRMVLVFSESDRKLHDQ